MLCANTSNNLQSVLDVLGSPPAQPKPIVYVPVTISRLLYSPAADLGPNQYIGEAQGSPVAVDQLCIPYKGSANQVLGGFRLELQNAVDGTNPMVFELLMGDIDNVTYNPTGISFTIPPSTKAATAPGPFNLPAGLGLILQCTAGSNEVAYTTGWVHLTANIEL